MIEHLLGFGAALFISFLTALHLSQRQADREFDRERQTPPEAPKLPQDESSAPSPAPEPPAPKTVPVTVPESELLPWVYGKRLAHNNWKNVRIICDQEGLTHQEKEELCATVWGESAFNTNARLDNRDVSGAVWSTDWGICQWNDYWHGKEISSYDAVHDPEKAVRLMCKYWKRGLASKKQWVAFSSGRYAQFMGRTL